MCTYEGGMLPSRAKHLPRKNNFVSCNDLALMIRC